MMRSLFAGVSGLKNHQTRMDVIGNNIANVNTIGFKKSRVTFQDMLSQTLQAASSPQSNRGGINPKQVGLGVSLASIDVVHSPGSPQSTGKNTDLSIEGEGFFVLSDGNNTYYSRAGNFDFDFNKNLINTSNGLMVKGVLADSNGDIDPKGQINNINLSAYVSSPPKATSEIVYSKNLDFRASSQIGTETSLKSAGADALLDLSANLPVTKVTIAGLIEDTDFTVDYDTGIVTIIDGAPNVVNGSYAVQYYQPNHQSTITVFDSKGDMHNVTVYYTKTGTNQWEVSTEIDNEFAANGTGTLTFDASTGQMASSTIGNVSKTLIGTDPIDIQLDFSSVTEYAGDFTSLPINQDGYREGSLQSIAVDASGTINGSFDNGQNRKLAQVAIATFPNPAGLIKAGSNLFEFTNNSGQPDAGVPGISGRGIIKPETLEMSNVDLSQEFVEMIITQRGFQANSRVITTSDQILEELVNLRR